MKIGHRLRPSRVYRHFKVSIQVIIFINDLQVRNEFYKDTQGVLLVFDVSSQQSFDSLHSWLSEMKKEIGDPADMDKVVFIVCANKVTTIFLFTTLQSKSEYRSITEYSNRAFLLPRFLFPNTKTRVARFYSNFGSILVQVFRYFSLVSKSL